MTEISAIVETVKLQYGNAGGAVASFIEIRDNGHEVVVGANRAGLLQLAVDLLVLADRGVKGSHVHIDEHSNADVAERALVLRLSDTNEA